MDDHGHTEPVVSEAEAARDSAFLTVRLPASTRVQLTLRLRLRTRTPRYRTRFDTCADQPRPGVEEDTP
ncbi:hypothetical protein ACIP39_12560 [Streptomyces tibetensis]|uniref:hypothetical protein n=1 Tax=Streptomyces tibetensis TaxID=2382123 RepID=UPI00381E98E4